MLVIDRTQNRQSKKRPRPIGIWGLVDENAAYLVLTKAYTADDRKSLGTAWSASRTTDQLTLINLMAVNGYPYPARTTRKSCIQETGGVPLSVWNSGHAFWAVRRTSTVAGAGAAAGVVDEGWYRAIRQAWGASAPFSEAARWDVPHPHRPDEGWTSLVVSSLGRLVDQGARLLDRDRPDPPKSELVEWVRGLLDRRLMLSLMAATGWDFPHETADRLVGINDRLRALLETKPHRVTELTCSAQNPSAQARSAVLAAMAPAGPEQAIVDRCRLLSVATDHQSAKNESTGVAHRRARIL